MILKKWNTKIFYEKQIKLKLEMLSWQLTEISYKNDNLMTT